MLTDPQEDYKQREHFLLTHKGIKKNLFYLMETSGTDTEQPLPRSFFRYGFLFFAENVPHIII